jgi:hypothetical protein
VRPCASIGPQPVDVDLGQTSTLMVEQALPPNRIRARGNSRSDAELAECLNGVARQV